MSPTTAPNPTTDTERNAVPLSRAWDVARYYGFTPLVDMRVNKEDRERVRTLGAVSAPVASFVLIHPEDKVALVRRYEEEHAGRLLAEPTLWYREEERRGEEGLVVHLDIVGTSQSIAEAILIKTAVEILRAGGARETRLHINSLGDRESFGRFTRELGAFYRRRVSALHAPCRAALRDDVLSILACPHDSCASLRAEAPEPVGFLSDPARTHFKEVLEHLETLETPYELSRHLIGPAGLCSHTVFDICNENGAPIASGFRYNHLARRVGSRREVPALGATLALAGQFARLGRRAKASAPAHFYFVQIGEAAKRRSLFIIELLRRAEIPLAQSIASDKLSTQIARAEALGTPFLIMVGQKEALEGTAIVRDRERSFQETIPLQRLASFLSRLLK